MRLKKIGVVLLALLLAAMAMVPMVSAGVLAPTVDSQNVVDKYYFAPDVQKDIIDQVGKSEITEKEKQDLIAALKEIWSGKSDRSDLEKDQIMLDLSKVLLKSMNAKWTGYPYPGGQTTHNEMASFAGRTMGIATAYQTILGQYAAEPDTWPGEIPPLYIQSDTHYRYTGAPDKAEQYANEARSFIKNWGDYTTGYTKLGYSMHFMSDMSCPYHATVPIYLANHQAYETYVGENWRSDKNYYADPYNDGYYYYISDVSDSAGYLASTSNGYLAEINSIMDNYSNWQDHSTLVQDTRTVLVAGERYDAGLINYVLR